MLKNVDKSTYKESTITKKRNSIDDIINIFDNITFKKPRIASDDDNNTIDKEISEKIIDFSPFFNSDSKEKTHLNLFYKDGFDKHGYDINGYDKDGYDEDGLDIDGYYKNGLDKDGYDEDGYDKDGNNMAGYDKNYINMINMLRTVYVEEQTYLKTVDPLKYDKDGFDKYGFDKYGFDKDGFNKDGFDKYDYDKDRKWNYKYNHDHYKYGYYPCENIKHYYFSKLHYNHDYKNINEKFGLDDNIRYWEDIIDEDEDEYLDGTIGDNRDNYDRDQYELNIFRLMKVRIAKDNEDDKNDPDYVPDTPEEPYEDYVSDHDYS
jgi:hypothetical protein